ncbi:MAG: hypothetical protein IPG45_11420 [Deltaproteobacteria bacterium]|jgi:hypothetical protein|nr:hypothetical protein [Deltaproteobacteria bacterium]
MRWAGAASLCFASLFASGLGEGSARAEPNADAAEIILQNRRPLAFIMFTPSGDTGATRSSEIIRWVSELFDQHTDFRLERRDADEAVECAGRLGCLAELVRADYQREGLRLENGSYGPYADHLNKLKEKKAVYPQYLLIVSKVADEDVDRISLTLLDTDAALEVIHEADRKKDGWRRDAEARVAQVAPVAKERSVEAKSEDEARRFIEDRIRGELRRRFEDEGHWEPYGIVELQCPVAGVAIKLDGTTVGTTRAGQTRLLNVLEGRHQLAFESPDFRPDERTVEVKRRETTQQRVDLMPLTSTSSTLRTATLWGGVGVAALGLGAVAFAVFRADPDVVTYCPVVGEGGDCGGSQFITFGYDTDPVPTFNEEVNPGGLMIAPLGLSLVGMGATWALGTLLFGTEEDLPWPQIVAGVLVGAAGYGVALALNGSSPYDR